MLGLLSQNVARQLDRDLLRVFALEQLVELAGMAIATVAQEELLPGVGRILVVAGPGNNGNDALVAARHLATIAPVDAILYRRGKTLLDAPMSDSFAWRLERQCQYAG